MNPEDLFRAALTATLPTGADVERGFVEITVKLKAGGEQLVRVGCVKSDELRRLILERYSSTKDFRELAWPTFAPPFNSPEFLKTLEPKSCGQLVTTATALFLGPEKLKRMIGDKFKERNLSLDAIAEALARKN